MNDPRSSSQSDRLARRKSTDGASQGGGNAATDSQARRYRTPLPGSLTSPVPPAPRRTGLIVAASTVVVACLLLIAWQVGLFESYAGGRPGLRWRATFPGAAGGPWTLILDRSELTTVSPTNQTTRSQVAQTFESGGRMRLSFDPPHPELGAFITITSTNPARVAVENDAGSAEVLP